MPRKQPDNPRQERQPADTPPPPRPRKRAPRVRRLRSQDDVAHELADLYRRSKRGDLPPDVAGRLGYLLSLLSRCLASRDWEAELRILQDRLSRLEREVP